MKFCTKGIFFQPSHYSLLVALNCLLGVTFPTAAQTLADALDTTNLVWTTGGDAVWFAQTTNTYDGVDAVRSGSISSNQTSWIETTVVGPATVSFWTVTSGFNSPFLGFTVNYDPYNNSPSSPLVPINSGGFWSKHTYDLGIRTNVLRAIVSSPYGGASQGFAVLDEFSVSPPRPLTINYQPYDSTVYSGEMAAVSVSAIGTPPLRYQWRKNETNIVNATNDWIYYQPATTNDAGVYSVIVSNSQGSVVSSNALLTVLRPSAPLFLYEPESVTAYSGQELNFWAAVAGSPPFNYQWRKDGTNLPGATWHSLNLSNISEADAGSYTLVVSNSFGGIESSNAVLTVVPSVAPVITRHPRSLDVAAGVSTWMSVEATGTPDPFYRWTKIGDSPPDPMPPLIGQNPHHSFNNVTTNDAGVYFATVSNPGGNVVSRDALLTVLPPMSITGAWGTGAEDVFVTNGLAFLAQGTSGLAILSVSNPASPQLLGSYDTAGYATAVRVSDGLAFVADGSAGLRIISVTNPSSPVLAGSYNTSGTAYDLVVRSNLVFVADGNAGLLILNVSNPAAPSVVGSYSTNLSPHHISLAGNFAYLSSPSQGIGPGSNYWVGGMLIVDVSNPVQPTEVGRFGSGFRTLDARDQLVFTLDVSSGLTIIDVTNPAQSSVIGRFNSYYSTNLFSRIGISANDVRVVNDLAYVAGYYEDQMKLFVLDVRNPGEPIPVGYFTAPGHTQALFVDGNRVYLAGFDSPLLIVETPFNPQPTPPPALSLLQQNGLKLQLQGRRGLNYSVEYADGLFGFPWQPLPTILLTNPSVAIEISTQPATRFFRVKQLD